MQKKDYVVPSWSLASSTTPTGFSLEIIKDGAIVDEISLECKEKTYFILGRQPDIVDILLEHPSISRQHAGLLIVDTVYSPNIDVFRAHFSASIPRRRSINVP